MTLFYISDQLAYFWKTSGLDLPPSFSLVTEHQMATSGILTSLMAMYIDEKGLRNEDIGRFMPDEHMRRSFISTRPVLFDKRFTLEDIRGEINVKKTAEKIMGGSLSIFDLLYVKKDSSNKPYINDSGMLYTGIMILNNTYRINNNLLDDHLIEQLFDDDKIEMATSLQTFLIDRKKR